MVCSLNIILDISMTTADMSLRCIRVHTLVTLGRLSDTIPRVAVGTVKSFKSAQDFPFLCNID